VVATSEEGRKLGFPNDTMRKKEKGIKVKK
jgi:hypothetical protein